MIFLGISIILSAIIIYSGLDNLVQAISGKKLSKIIEKR